MTTLTDRERELVEAAQVTFYNLNPESSYARRLLKALRAYDPPKRKYTMPTWEEFSKKKHPLENRIDAQIANVMCFDVPDGSPIVVHEIQYNAIREALSTEET